MVCAREFVVDEDDDLCEKKGRVEEKNKKKRSIQRMHNTKRES
jgi:hypothetical protein